MDLYMEVFFLYLYTLCTNFYDYDSTKFKDKYIKDLYQLCTSYSNFLGLKKTLNK